MAVCRMKILFVTWRYWHESIESGNFNAKSPVIGLGFLHEFSVGWLMGLEPTTTGITILDSTN